MQSGQEDQSIKESRSRTFSARGVFLPLETQQTPLVNQTLTYWGNDLKIPFQKEIGVL